MTRKTTTILSLVIASVLVPLLGPGIAIAHSTSKASCPGGHICIYPKINYNGTPFVRRDTDGSISLDGMPIENNTFSVSNSSTSKTARIYRTDNYSGPHTCIQPGDQIPDLQHFAVGHEGSSLKINNDRCG